MSRSWTLQKFRATSMLKQFSPQVDAVFARNDVNHDGKLTRKEFEDFLNVHGKKD